MIKLDCPKCGTGLTYGDELRGGAARCYQCGTMLTLPRELSHVPGNPPDMRDQVQPLLPDREIDDASMTTVLELASATRTLSLTRHARVQGATTGLWMVVAALVLSAGMLGAAAMIVSHLPERMSTPATDSNPVQKPASLPTLEMFQAAIPEADGDFLIGQMSRGRTIEQARAQWLTHSRRPRFTIEIGLPAFVIESDQHATQQPNLHRLSFWRDTTAFATFDMPRSGAYELTLSASGPAVEGEYPRIKAFFDGVQILDRHLSSNEPESLTTRLEITEGQHIIGVGFANDLYDPERKLNRDLFVHSVRLVPIED